MVINEMNKQLLDQAFINREGINVFSSWVQASEIWKRDPYDVSTIHENTRHVFYDLVENNLSSKEHQLDRGGRTFLILGESGAGKTHLMRAFRNHIHSNNYGYFGYMQMTSPANNYARFILSNFISSLDQPYHDPVQMET